VSNSKTTPVPVAEQNLDANGNIKVHEQGTANVNVTNSSVPVHEQGTADANITNTDPNGNLKVHEQGTANVSVANATTNPVPVRDVGNDAFMRNETLILDPGQTFSSICDYTPAGKRFAMQYIDLRTNGIASDQIVWVTLDVSTQGAFVEHSLPLESTVGQVPMFTSRVSLYADPGSGFCLSIHRDASNTAGTIRADYSVSGYLVDA
jgi:hypothetical protein